MNNFYIPIYIYILTTGHTFTDFEIEKIGVIVDMLLAAGIVKLTNQSCEVYYKVYAVSFVTVNAIFHNYIIWILRWRNGGVNFLVKRNNTMTCQP